MRLFSWKVLAVVVAATLACGDSTGPTSIPGVFILQSIKAQDPNRPEDGRFQVLAGTVTLEADGTAILMERRIDFTVTPAAQEIVTRNVSYELDGHRIIIHPDDCPPNAVCVNTKGVLINHELMLDSPFGSGFTYLYHRETSE